MTLMTRLFGRKIEGGPLKQLIEAIGENPNKVLDSHLPKWFVSKVHGKCGLTPVVDGIAVDLYIFKTALHRVDGTLGIDYDTVWDYDANPHRFLRQDKEVVYSKDIIRLTGRIPYKQGDAQ